MFLYCVNDSFNVCKQLLSTVLKDDKTLFASGHDYGDFVNLFNNELKIISTLTKSNLLFLNVGKAYPMLFSNRFVDDTRSDLWMFDERELEI